MSSVLLRHSLLHEGIQAGEGLASAGDKVKPHQANLGIDSHIPAHGICITLIGDAWVCHFRIVMDIHPYMSTLKADPALLGIHKDRVHEGVVGHITQQFTGSSPP